MKPLKRIASAVTGIALATNLATAAAKAQPTAPHPRLNFETMRACIETFRRKNPGVPEANNVVSVHVNGVTCDVHSYADAQSPGGRNEMCQFSVNLTSQEAHGKRNIPDQVSVYENPGFDGASANITANFTPYELSDALFLGVQSDGRAVDSLTGEPMRTPQDLHPTLGDAQKIRDYCFPAIS